VLYPQNGVRIVTTDSATSLHPMYTASHGSVRPRSIAHLTPHSVTHIGPQCIDSRRNEFHVPRVRSHGMRRRDATGSGLNEPYKSSSTFVNVVWTKGVENIAKWSRVLIGAACHLIVNKFSNKYYTQYFFQTIAIETKMTKWTVSKQPVPDILSRFGFFNSRNVCLYTII